MEKIIRITTLIAIAIYITGCGNTGTEKKSGKQKAVTSEEKNEKDHSEENTVTLTQQQWDAINIKLGDLEKVNLDGTLKVTGELELYPQDEATVGTFMDGNISRLFVKPGEKVKKGQLLAYIEDPSFIDLQAELKQLYSEFQYLKQEFERQQKLYENEVASGKSYQKTTSEYNVVKARLESIKAKLRLLKVNPEAIINGKTYNALPIISPINGYVREIGGTIGQRITTGSQLFRIINKENIHADLLVYEKDLGKVKEGQKVTLYIANNRDNPVEGTITEIGKNYENTIRAVRMHAGLDGDKEPFVPGMFVEGVIAVKNVKTTALPEQAVVEDEGKTYVFIKRENTKDTGEHPWVFTRTEVITGSITDGWIEVKSLDSLPENVGVVTEGAYYLLAEMKKGETEHSH
ncbi:efflux RND transporter periplasmic adaptor subunit [Sinomicrobium weinanense]|uniref:Efflux RND transporter periplasmic adaptor subunit n=1 Tax=Sinomicrobium weinanense TaxID=2842200 RepID=A0A926JSJ4_9FLAO|nr:efflux RND transporter periplasmic adaptor subunit [Sinomicrobium weinanense]MBC9796727.1 efflux RND transporter periplasmic adaptor subunit [Sinomicrobium weinanense]MBU3123998.1 efflux RND transporter periplasmic adaptor subunit [Sinomicrobium weinanense]